MTNRTWQIRLVYDRLPLSLNDREHHMVTWRKRQNLIDQVHAMCRHHGIPQLQRVHVRMEWTPRTNRRRDADNATETLKAALDGIRNAPPSKRWPAGRIGIVPDDTPEYVTWEPPIIHPTNRDPFYTERLVLVIEDRSDAA